RLGINFNLLRESFRLLQLIDSTFDYEKDLGLYRYKYSTMRQLKMIKEVNFMYKILKNEDTPFILQRKIWQDFFNGVKEYLKNNLNNLILRLSNKRDKKIKPLTKQRKESVYDLTFTKNFLTNFTEEDKKRAKMHLSEAIKHYKAGLAYVTNDELLNNAIKQALVSFESDYIQETKKLIDNLKNRKIEKVEYKKLMGRLNRLDIKKEKLRQITYLKDGPNNDYLFFYEDFLRIKKRFIYDHLETKITFPEFNYLTENIVKEILTIFNIEEEPKEFFNYITNTLLTTNSFVVSYKRNDYFDDSFYFNDSCRLTGKFNDNLEIIDLFLVKYLKSFIINRKKNYFNDWLEKKNILFNNLNSYSFNLFNSFDLNVLNKILNHFMDVNLVSFIIKRYNSAVIYKDMKYYNNVGLIDIKISEFIYNLLLIIVDNILMNEDIYHRINEIVLTKEIKIPSYLINSVFKNNDIILNNYLFDSQGKKLCLTYKYQNMLELKLKKLIRSSNCLSFNTISIKWNSFLKKVEINDQIMPLLLIYQKKILDCVKRGISSRMSNRFPLFIFY
ncbi:hypothetical protein H312_03096, partial [Anncaliia algerae PRA339]